MSKKIGIWLCFFLFLVLTTLQAETPATSASAATAGKPQNSGYVKMNVFAILSENLNDHAKQVSLKLKEQTGLEAFPGLGFQVHCTLYMTSYETDKVDQVRDLIASLSADIRPFPVSTTGLSATKDFWLFINLEKNRNLQTLSDLLVKELSPLRSANQPVPSWLQNYPEKLEYFKQFGSPNVFGQFEPHITLLAKSDQGKVEKFIKDAQTDQKTFGPQSGTVVGVGVAIADGVGQMKEAIAKFYFK